MMQRKQQIIKVLKRRYNVYRFTGEGFAYLSRKGCAVKGEPRTVEVRVPDWIAYNLV